MFIQNLARNPVLVNNRLSAASYRTQTLASNLAKSQPAEHWHIEEGKAPEHRKERRPAGYFYHDSKAPTSDSEPEALGH